MLAPMATASTTEPRFERVLDLDALPVGEAATVKRPGKQVAVFRTAQDEVHAVDNLCPHEGYPLAPGAVKDGLLTCEWHNWKFRLSDGVCVLGGEDVRRYPVRIEDGGIFLDLSDPPPSALIPGLYRSIEAGFEENDFGRVARDNERLLACGERPEKILAFACRWNAEHAKYGFEHGLATAADLAALMQREARKGEAGAVGVPLLQAMNVLVEPHLRRPRRILPDAEVPPARPERPDDPEDPAWREAETRFRARVEAEDQAGAEALFRGALEAGAGPAVVHRWLVHAATDHFLSFGHRHIYCVKAEELLEAIGFDHAHPILTSLVGAIVLGTREDVLPYMRAYDRAMAAHRPHLHRWAQARPDGAAEAPFDPEPFVETILDGGLDHALDAVAGALDQGAAPTRIALALSAAASIRMLRFDPRIDLREDVAESWLYTTHELTHADAVFATLERRPTPETLRSLFHSARFIEHMHPLDLPLECRPAVPWTAPTAPGADDPAAEAAVSDTIAAIAAADGTAAIEAALAAFRLAPARLAGALLDACHADLLVRPIFVDHQVKTTCAALRLTRAMAADPALAPMAHLPVVATVRFLAHPHRERRISRAARQAAAFVRRGEMPGAILPY
jgi:nitrite reductase/ring-hydroxylating ferredoxin subunit